MIDADLLGHRAYLPDTECYRRVVAAFGQEIVNPADQTIDRRVLGSKVFGRPEEMKRLTDVVYPEIERLARVEIAALASQGKPLCVLEAAVLVEAGWRHLVGEVWVVVVDPETAVSRLMARNKLDEPAARARLASQLSNEERIAAADVVIENNDTVEHLMARVKSILESKPCCLSILSKV